MLNLNDLSLAELYALRVALNQRIGEFESEARSALEAGAEVHNFVLKPGRKNRKVHSEVELVAALEARGVKRAALYDAKLKGVPALEKMFKAQFSAEEAAELMERHIDVTESAPSLVYTGESE